MKDQRTILVIDDAAMFRDLASFVLSRSGHVVTARTGEEGLAAARRERPEVAVVDLDLPQMNGD
ncbi:MAG: response regulator, partial [Myxococcota bacterium]